MSTLRQAEDHEALTQMTPLVRDTLHERAYLELQRMLMTGAFRPGMELSLRMLARQLGTSEMPVREAVRRLIAEHALQSLPSRKVIVPHVDAAQFRELLLIRTLLESEAARQASPRIGRQELHRLEELLGGMVRLEPNADAAYLDLNQQFHFTIYRACGMPLLLSTIEKLWLRIGPIFTHIPVHIARNQSNDQHRRVLSALTRRDATEAGAAIAADLSEVGARLLVMLEGLQAVSQR